MPSINTSNPNTHIDISKGHCMDDTNEMFIKSNSILTKEIVNPSANTIYNIFIIKNDNDEVDIHFDTNKTTPTLPSGYNYKRWLGWIRTNNNGYIIPCDWIGSGLIVEMWFKSRQTVATGLNQTSYTIQSLAGWIPAGCIVRCCLGGLVHLITW